MSTGSPHPEPPAGASAEGIALRGGIPRVVARVHEWRNAGEDPETLKVIRAELRGLGAVLVVLSAEGSWSFGPDDEVERVSRARAPDARGDAHEGDLVVYDELGQVRFTGALRGDGESAGRAIAAGLEEAGRSLVSHTPPFALSRRDMVTASLVCAFALVLATGCDRKTTPVTTAATVPGRAPDFEREVTLSVNGTDRTVRVDVRTSLLDALRERLGLTGTKKACDHGQCGACTVLLDDRRVCSCLTLAVMAQGQRITTIEGLAEGDHLHPVQAAFVSEDALQCGYCTPGQIMSAVGLLAEGHAQTDDEVREEMSGNICRCGAYPNIVAAVQLARKTRG
ncbi:MAG TPA: (2Fe-2S)-binding protein [Polyangiaceae bacterium]|jgi:xanthine dehydrogenase YagT iron-sulfur-binding subunit